MSTPTRAGTSSPPPPPLHPSGIKGSPVKDEEVESVPESDGENSDTQSIDDIAPSTSANQKGKAADSSIKAQSVPLQKRRRVTRACDECRRKKIKCDGKQPCTHCQVYSYDCTYDKPSNRRRNPAPQYIEALEQKLQRAEALLRKFMPDVDLNDPNLDLSVQQEFRLREQARAQTLLRDDASGSSSSSKDAKLLSMISGAGQLDLDEKGDYDFHGLSSGAVFFRRMKEHFRTLLGRDYKIPSLPRGSGRTPGAGLNFDSPKSSATGEMTASSADLYNLPPKEVARTLCSYSFNYATCLLRIVHIPSFYEMLDELYEKQPGSFGEDDDRHLALVYSVLALGCMYDVHDDGDLDTPPYEMAMEEGLKYYTSARLLLQDLTDCRDLTSLQALLFMILFMQSISNLSTCYGFVGIALRSALRMGLHRHLPQMQVNPIESETRRRIFYVCRQLDIYVSALLGFPLLLNDEDVDQPLPTPVDDQFITINGILPVPSGTICFFEAFNAHARLMDILSKVIKHIYPLKGIEHTAAEGEQPTGSYVISYTKVKEMEKSLQQWNEQLPVAWRPNSDGSEEVVRVRNLLRFAYAHVQMVLYRPFLHYVSPRVCVGKNVDERSYACGAAGINIARNIVHIGAEMRKQVSLVGPYWFTFFTEFFAVISLVFFVLENQDKPGTNEILADAIAGRDMITTLARRSMIADSIAKNLQTLFEQLPKNLKKIKATTVPTRKRSAPGSKSGFIAMPSPSTLKAKISSHLPEEFGRSKSGSSKPGRSSKESVRPKVSYDPLNLQTGLDFGASSFSTTSPLDLSVGTPESTSSGNLYEPSPNLHHTTVGLNPLHRLDAMMFPSEDPLAYPNQPGFDFGPPGQSLSPDMAHPPQDTQQFYMPNYFDGIEGQLMGPLPPFLMQNPGQSGFDFPAQIYSDPVLSLHMQQSQHRQQQRHPQALSQSQQQHHQPQHSAAQQQHQFSNAPWSGMFPHYD
ncbi:fungal-specific transcription factor domain-containing protein [Pseudomassariella vexata]|uniref:Fungal-specific transcription factor domain-domain-containing protein n=1 Tax=Pseudomassariella vexata TaxID=1141098 RepID=A0A1Y2EEQ9_9PEZI|nr:fungal-specific transcription factor domain-containing protein [Pseudomassariella vexata]ORY70049.1 fungal-specific transcription factor domain-domain-containing protein [Pseudomassariella vexata]